MSRPSAAVVASPTKRLMNTAKISRADLSASHRMTSTTTTVPTPLTSAPCCTVANSSSAIGTEPVRRTRAWYFSRKLEIARRLADSVARRLAGHQRGKIQHRTHFDDPAQVVRRCTMAVQHLLPGEGCRLPRKRLLEGRRRHRQRAGQVVERHQLVAHADQAERERAGQAAQGGVAGQRHDHGSGAGQALGQPLHVLGRLKQQPVAAEKVIAAHVLDRAEQVLARRQLPGELGAGDRGEFGRRGVHNHQSRLEMTGKCLLEGHFPLPPVEVRRNQLVDIGTDSEMAGGIERGARPRQQS